MIRRCRYSVPLPDRSPLQLGERTLVMGVVNVTPDSFSDGGRWQEPDRAVDHAMDMEAAGAAVLDIGGESTRPGAVALSAKAELDRVVPVLERLAGCVSVPLSIDTYKAEVARVAIDHGATIINDISGLLYEPALAKVVAEGRAALILMHNRGRSKDMYRQARYGDVGREVASELSMSIDSAVQAGIKRSQIIIDPGLGFAKYTEHNYAALLGLGRLAALDRPVLVGPSRKSFLSGTHELRPTDREWGTAAAITAAIFEGAHMVRVHRVPEMIRVVEVADRFLAVNERLSFQKAEDNRLAEPASSGAGLLGQRQS